MDHAFFDGDDIFILPRQAPTITTIHVDLPPVEREDTVLPSVVVRHFVERSRYHFLMNNCICRTTAQCRDYPRDLGCLFLGKATLKIDPRLGRMVSKEEALQHLDRCAQAGLVHLIGRNKIDSVWTSATPKEDLMTICNCCPCCCLWKMLPELSPGISQKIKRMPGLRITVDDNCMGCGECLEDCYVHAIGISDGRAIINDELCKCCGRCVERCPEKAIHIEVLDPSFIETTINELAPLVDVSKE